MKKDKEWLKEEVKSLFDNAYDLGKMEYHESEESIHRINSLIDQLDEPEKTVIPQFVADCIEEERAKIRDWHTEIPERFFLILGHKLHYTALANTNISGWVFDGNEEKLYQALKYGYEVEKEKRYYISDEMDNATLMTFDLSDEDGKEIIEFVVGYSENETIHFDSKEKAELIARFVGDSVKVEEVEE